MSLTNDTPERNGIATRRPRLAGAVRRPDTRPRVPRRRWAIVSRFGPALRTVIVPADAPPARMTT